MAVATAAVLAIIAIVAIMLRERLPSPDNIVSDPPKENLPEIDPNRESIVQDAPNPGLNGVAPQSPDRVAPNTPMISPDPGKVRENMVDAPVVNPGTIPIAPQKPIVPDSDSPQRVPSALAALVREWSDDGGIVVVRSSSTAAWCGVKSSAAETIREASAEATVMTMQSSRAELSLVGTGKIIVDGESSVEIHAPESVITGPADVNKKESSASLKFEGHLLLNYGRVVFNQIPAGKQFSVRIADVAYTLEATDENTIIGVDSTGEFPVFSVFRGEAIVDEHRLTRRVWGRAESIRGLTEFSDIADDQDWTRKRIASNAIPRSLADPVNSSDTTVMAVAELRTDENAAVAFYATQVLLQCSETVERPVSVDIIRKAAFSPTESIRHSLAYWLLLELKHDQGRDPQLIDALLQPIGFQVDQQSVLKEWFIAANAGQRPTQQHLTELQTALRNTGPVFGRQCAKFFLQTILADPLSEYDPAAPSNRTALNSITRKMRTWQQKNMP